MRRKIVWPDPTEHQEQAALCKWLLQRGIMFFAIPNAAKRSPKTAAFLKAEGMKSGAPDLVLLQRPRRFPGYHVAVEMKRKKGGKVSDEQKDLHLIMTANGWHIIVAFGLVDAINQLLELGY